ncbi:hypothetical protein ACVWZM_001561 [Bradyrhizobium sp. USDA 4501]
MTPQTFSAGRRREISRLYAVLQKPITRPVPALAIQTDVLVCGEWVDVDYGGVIRRGVVTGRLELVRRAPKDAYAARWTDHTDEADLLREWP